jgi:hypothetical protein
MSAMSDAIISYAILRKFTTPIKETDAYRLELVDENGVPTEKSRYEHTERAKDAYTLLDRLVFKLKRLWKNMPAFAKLIGGYATALAFLKEDTNNDFSVFENLDSTKADYWGKVLLGESIVGIDQHYIIKVAEDPSMLRKLVEAYQDGTQDSFIFEDGEGAPAMSGNAASTGAVSGMTPDTLGISKKKQKEIQNKNWEVSPNGRKIEEIIS